MSERLAARLAALRMALEVGGGCLDPSLRHEAEEIVDRAGERLALSPEHTVVALAGPTGSGKSSLFNCLAGLDLARVGIRRPTTSETLACVWGPEGAEPLLSWLGIGRRHQIARESALDAGDRGGRSSELRGLVLLDLPDHDSTQLEHRLQVDRLARLVDLLVWVVDPQKYADALLHDRYLRPLSGHGDVMLVVLNQADRLSEDSAARCMDDLARLLRADGLVDPRIVRASAATGEGVPTLRGVLAEAVQERTARVRRLEADLERVALPLLDSLQGKPGSVGRKTRTTLVDALAAAAGVPAVTAAVAGSVRHRSILAAGWPFTRWLRRARPDPLRRLGVERRAGRSSVPEPPPVARAAVDVAVRRVAEAAAGTLPPSWAQSIRETARGRGPDLADALDRAVVGTDIGASRRAWWWRPVSLLQWLLAACVIVGLGWLAVLWGADYLRVPEPPTPKVGRADLPTLLAIGGVVAGLLVAGAGRLFARVTARARARRARTRLRDAVKVVAIEHVLDPVEEQLHQWEAVRSALQVARGAGAARPAR